MTDRLPSSTQRVRIGLTGLASVFLLVMLGAVFSRASDEEPITANGIEAATGLGAAPPANTAATPDEPLAELGVAPGSTPANDAAVDTPDTVAVEDPLRPQRRR